MLHHASCFMLLKAGLSTHELQDKAIWLLCPAARIAFPPFLQSTIPQPKFAQIEKLRRTHTSCALQLTGSNLVWPTILKQLTRGLMENARFSVPANPKCLSCDIIMVLAYQIRYEQLGCSPRGWRLQIWIKPRLKTTYCTERLLHADFVKMASNTGKPKVNILPPEVLALNSRP